MPGPSRARPKRGFALLLNLLGHWAGWPFPGDGVGEFMKAFKSELADPDVSVRPGAPVERIDVERRATFMAPFSVDPRPHSV
ncbi:MAG: hypothetical protein ICV69_15260 [Thermoleophilaceae bacterium]|nr:hypothetical protein [Thermoleophilaceae bacterium]